MVRSLRELGDHVRYPAKKYFLTSTQNHMAKKKPTSAAPSDLASLESRIADLESAMASVHEVIPMITEFMDGMRGSVKKLNELDNFINIEIPKSMKIATDEFMQLLSNVGGVEVVIQSSPALFSGAKLARAKQQILHRTLTNPRQIEISNNAIRIFDGIIDIHG